MIPRRWILVIAAFLIASACTEPDGGSTTFASDSAGIRIWHPDRSRLADPVASTHVGDLAVPDSGWVVESDGVAVDPKSGLIYILDELAPHVLVFDTSGSFLKTIGQEGEGPGEFTAPAALDVGDDGTLYVVDPGRGLILRWNPAGEFQGQVRLRVPYWGPGFSAKEDGVVYVRSEQDPTTGSVTEILVDSHNDGSFDDVESFVQPWVLVELPCGRFPVPVVMAPSLVWAAGSTHVAVAIWPESVIDVYEGGALARSFRLDIPAPPVSREAAEEAVRTGQLQFLVDDCGVSAAQVVDLVGYVERSSPISQLAVDPRGRVWARSTSEHGVNRTYILDGEVGVGDVVEAPSFPVAFISPHRYLSIAEQVWGSRVEIWEVSDPVISTGRSNKR